MYVCTCFTDVVGLRSGCGESSNQSDEIGFVKMIGSRVYTNFSKKFYNSIFWNACAHQLMWQFSFTQRSIEFKVYEGQIGILSL